jgi:hypothetical protein
MIVVNHPKFTNVRLVSEGTKKQMQLSMGVDEKEYERWKQSLTKAKIDSTSLLLPTKDEFSRKGFCGDSGTLKVPTSSFSSTTITSATSSLRKSTTETVARASSKNGNSGTYFSVFPLRSRRSKRKRETK